jgi:hypothetical protein
VRTAFAGFPRSCRFRAAARAVGQAGAPAAAAPVRARARTNELDAGKRWPMIGGVGEPAELWLPGRGSLGGSRVRSGGVVSHPPIRPLARWRGHDRAIRGPGCSVSSPSAGRGPAQANLRARPEPGDLLLVCHRVPSGAVGAAAGGGIACPASVSRCQARVSSLRATAVVAIFFPRRLAMAGRWRRTVASAWRSAPPRTAPSAATPSPCFPDVPVVGDAVAAAHGRWRARPRTPACAPTQTG